MTTELKNVGFSYNGRPILTDFNLQLSDGECVCLSGPSGCGKTTVLKLILGLLTPETGEVISPQRPSVVFQEDRLLNGFSLKKNILLPLPKEQHGFALELLREAGLGDELNKKVSNLSGGMKRRAAIVRAVAFQGDMLILDEPFNGIDSENKVKTAEMIKREFLNNGKSVLIVSHIEADAELLNAKKVFVNQK